MAANASFTSDSDDIEFTSPIGERDNRRTYLLTYSQADLERFPTRETFSRCVLEAFDEGKSSKKITEWACSMENHADNVSKHYHMAVKLSGTRRWNPIKSFLYKQHKISVHFSAKPVGYVAAYRYVCKDKLITEVLHSEGHSDMEVIGSPKTKKAMCKSFSNARKRNSTASSTGTTEETLSGSSALAPTAKVKRLTNTDVSRFLVKHNISKESELMKFALQRSANGECDLERFILNKTPKALVDLIATTWKMQSAPQTVEREGSSRIDIIKKHSKQECVNNCAGIWLESAREVLRKNNINVFVFASALRQSFMKGRQKNTNVLLIGPTNCGKSFLLNPIEIIFTTFINPATGRYAWVGIDECEVAYLNDFRWSAEIIAWSDFLLLLEGQTIHLPRPKNMYATDMCIDRSNTIPFFATSKGPIEYMGRYNICDERETEMMSSRWLTFPFSYQIPNSEVKNIEPCPACFSKLVFLGSEMDS